MAREQSTTPPQGGPSWKPVAGASALGGGAVGAAGAFGITHATSEQIAWGVAIWSLTTLAGVIAFLGKSWVERRFVHVQELLDSNGREQTAWLIVTRSIGAGKQAVSAAEQAARTTSEVATKPPSTAELRATVHDLVIEIMEGRSRGKAEDGPP